MESLRQEIDMKRTYGFLVWKLMRFDLRDETSRCQTSQGCPLTKPVKRQRPNAISNVLGFSLLQRDKAYKKSELKI